MIELGWKRVSEPHILGVPCLILSGNAHDLVSWPLAPLTSPSLLSWVPDPLCWWEYPTPLKLKFQLQVQGTCKWEWEPGKSSTIKPRLLFLTWPPEKYFYKQDGVLIFFWYSNVAFKFTLCWIWNLWVWKPGDISKAPRTVDSPGENQLD